MDWSAIVGLLRCEPGGSSLQPLFAIIGAVASVISIAVAIYRFWRWWQGPLAKHRRAARALRKQGYYHARLNHRAQAMELYDLAIQLNPRAAHVHFLRGELHLKMGERSRAIADWQRCVQRHPHHQQALQRLAAQGIIQPNGRGWAYVGGGAAALLLISLITIAIL